MKSATAPMIQAMGGMADRMVLRLNPTVSLTALANRDPERPRPYRLPYPKVLSPIGFVSANLIIYWSGFEATWKILAAIFLGRVVFEIALHRMRNQ